MSEIKKVIVTKNLSKRCSYDNGIYLLKMWGWKEDLKYYFKLPKYFLVAIWWIITRNPIDAEEPFSWREKITLAKSFCDARAGRYYEWVE
ncbi:MAG: hypothetical protein N2V78_09300 [Methanophagales archaeon]|nr:hypothetical protein [Methanophagales archaeon]